MTTTMSKERTSPDLDTKPLDSTLNDVKVTGKTLKPKSRKRVNTAEKRASHNAVERQRREMLNSRFLVGRIV